MNDLRPSAELRKKFGKKAVHIKFFSEVNAVTIKKLLKRIEQAGAGRKIVLYIMTNGGNPNVAIDFKEAIRISAVRLVTVGVSRVYSAGILLLLAGEEIYATADTDFMIHKIENSICDQLGYQEHYRIGRRLRRDNLKLKKMFARYLKISEESIEDMLARGDFFDAEHAKKIGLIHGIVGKGRKRK